MTLRLSVGPPRFKCTCWAPIVGAGTLYDDAFSHDQASATMSPDDLLGCCCRIRLHVSSLDVTTLLSLDSRDLLGFPLGRPFGMTEGIIQICRRKALCIDGFGNGPWHRTSHDRWTRFYSQMAIPRLYSVVVCQWRFPPSRRCRNSLFSSIMLSTPDPIPSDPPRGADASTPGEISDVNISRD